MDDVKSFLTSANLQQYHETLVEEGYDDAFTLSAVTVEELVDAGVKKGHAKKLRALIDQELEKVKGAEAQVAAEASSNNNNNAGNNKGDGKLYFYIENQVEKRRSF